MLAYLLAPPVFFPFASYLHMFVTLHQTSCNVKPLDVEDSRTLVWKALAQGPACRALRQPGSRARAGPPAARTQGSEHHPVAGDRGLALQGGVMGVLQHQEVLQGDYASLIPW